MAIGTIATSNEPGPRLPDWPLPGKVLATMIIIMLALGMGGALGQIVVHDIIPTFRGETAGHTMPDRQSPATPETERGDLFAEAPVEKEAPPFYATDEFIFALKFTHIHIFGMSAIFIVMGAIVLFLDLSVRARIWLIVLPFIGIAIDLASVWLKIFVHPGFFWLHMPGGGLFGAVFIVEFLLVFRALWFK